MKHQKQGFTDEIFNNHPEKKKKLMAYSFLENYF